MVLSKWKNLGYHISLFFLTLPSAGMALARQVAVQTGTAIVVSKDGELIWRTAAELTRLERIEVKK